MRGLCGFLCLLALGIMPLGGCSETTGDGGDAGSGGMAGDGGSGGIAGINGVGGYSGYPSLCDGVDCNDHDACTIDRCDYGDGSCEHTPAICNDDNECTDDDCNPLEGCHYPPVADGTSCGAGAAACQGGSCVGTFACTEAGIRQAIAVGGGPHTFGCAGPTTVAAKSEIIIDNDVILDGEGNLTVDAGHRGGEPTEDDHIVFIVYGLAELRGFTVTGGWSRSVGGIQNSGTLTLTSTSVSGNAGEHVGGISNRSTLTMVNCTVFENWSWEGVGGIRNSGTLTLKNSTVSYNGGQRVGGIVSAGPRSLSSLINSTVSENSGTLCDGIDNEAGIGSGMVVIANSTVSEDVGSICANVGHARKTASELGSETVSWVRKSWTNSARSADPTAVRVGAGGAAGSAGFGGGAGGGGGFGGFGGWPGEFTVANSLVVGDCTGEHDITSKGYNIESPGDTCGFNQRGDQAGVSADDLNVGPLQDNGGPTETHALSTVPVVSAAINQIPEADCVDADDAPLTEDQRDEPRPETGGTNCDVGAFERQSDDP